MPAPKPKTQIQCAKCGKDILLSPWQVAGGQKYCSKRCAVEGRIGSFLAKNSKPKINVICQNCGKVFQVHPYRADSAKYCSPSCRSKQPKASKKSKVKLICQQCGKEYLVYPSGSDSKFCSHSCASKGKFTGRRSLKRTSVCPHCSKEFFINYEGQKYCSVSCHDAARRKRVTVKCFNCGKTFERNKSHSGRYSREFCSHKCFMDYATGENSPHWRGGNKEYPPSFNARFKRMIRERDNFTCALCGKHGNNVHHINYVKEDTRPENCITLCRNCHCKTNSNREYWQEYFMRLTRCAPGFLRSRAQK